LTGPKLEILNDTIIAITGADLSPSLNDVAVPLYEPFKVKKGDILSFGSRKWGCRSYLAIKGGIACEKIMGSYSTDVRIGFGGFKLQKNQLIKSANFDSLKPKIIDTSFIYNDFIFSTTATVPNRLIEIEVIEGPDFEFFYPESFDILYKNEYTVTSHLDRSGIRLQGAFITKKDEEMLSRPTECGNIQITSDGQPIILGVECQTIGGYPRIACVPSSQLSKLAQLFTDDKIKFKKINIDEAIEKFRSLAQLFL
jgi:antagonist of KipI